jgi:AmmeMemoRadiSam system protein A
MASGKTVGRRLPVNLRVICMAIAISAALGCAGNTEPVQNKTLDIEEEAPLTDADKEYLLNLARATLDSYLRDGKTIPVPDEEDINENLQRKLGCFVTLEKEGVGLWGCIGIFSPADPLYKNVISRAILAATVDDRFPRPVRHRELEHIKIEISVLTESTQLEFESTEELLAKLRPGIDGVQLLTPYGRGSSTYLPQVWDQLPDKKEFLSRLCLKQGAPANAWKLGPEKVRVLTYQAIVFSEPEAGRQVVGEKGAVAGPGGAVVVGKLVPPGIDDKPAKPEQVKPGTELPAGTVVSADSDITP